MNALGYTFPETPAPLPAIPSVIKNGTILVEESAPIPNFMELEPETYAGSWKIVKGVEGYGLDRDMHKIGWSFFHAAAQIKITRWGLGVQHTVRAALKSVLWKLKYQKFNCLEIHALEAKKVFGVSIITITAYPRNISTSRI